MSKDRIVRIVLTAKDQSDAVFKKLGVNLTDTQKKHIAMAAAAVAAGGAVIAIVQRMGQAYAKLVTEAQKMQTAMAEVNTLLNAQPDTVVKLEGTLRGLAVQFGQTNDIMARAEYNVISAGFSDAADSVNILTVAGKAATAGLTDINTAARSLTNIINAYGKSADDAAKISDILFATVKKGVTTFPELANNMGTVLATASAAKIPLEDVAAAIAAMTTAGINTTEATTALNALLVAIAAGSGESKDKMDELGITLDEGLGPALIKLAEAGGQGLSVLKELIPNVRALKAAASAGREGGRQFNEALAEIRDSTGATNKAFDIMAATSEFATRRAAASFSNLKDAIGASGLEAKATVLNAVADGIGKIAEEAGDANKPLETLLNALARLAELNLDKSLSGAARLIDVIGRLTGLAFSTELATITAAMAAMDAQADEAPDAVGEMVDAYNRAADVYNSAIDLLEKMEIQATATNEAVKDFSFPELDFGESDVVQKYLEGIRTQVEGMQAEGAMIDIPVNIEPPEDWTLPILAENEAMAAALSDTWMDMRWGFAQVFADGVTGFLQVSREAKGFAADLMRVVVAALNEVIVKLIAIKILKAFIPFLPFGEGGQVPKMAAGGKIPQAAYGYAVPDGPRGLDSVLINAMPGEQVIDRSLSRDLRRFLDAARMAAPISPFALAGAGAGAGGNVHLHVDRLSSRAAAVAAAEDIADALDRRSRRYG